MLQNTSRSSYLSPKDQNTQPWRGWVVLQRSHISKWLMFDLSQGTFPVHQDPCLSAREGLDEQWCLCLFPRDSGARTEGSEGCLLTPSVLGQCAGRRQDCPALSVLLFLSWQVELSCDQSGYREQTFPSQMHPAFCRQAIERGLGSEGLSVNWVGVGQGKPYHHAHPLSQTVPNAGNSLSMKWGYGVRKT